MGASPSSSSLGEHVKACFSPDSVPGFFLLLSDLLPPPTVRPGSPVQVQRGFDLNIQRLRVIDGSRALRSGIEQMCAKDARVQRCRIHRIRDVTERLPTEPAEQVHWTAAGFLEAEKSFKKLRAHVDLRILIDALRPTTQQIKKAA